jgi:hypothetical protein
MCLLQNFGILAQTLVDMADHLSQLLLDQLCAVIQHLSELHAKLIDLLLH